MNCCGSPTSDPDPAGSPCPRCPGPALAGPRAGSAPQPGAAQAATAVRSPRLLGPRPQLHHPHPHRENWRAAKAHTRQAWPASATNCLVRTSANVSRLGCSPGLLRGCRHLLVPQWPDRCLLSAGALSGLGPMGWEGVGVVWWVVNLVRRAIPFFGLPQVPRAPPRHAAQWRRAAGVPRWCVQRWWVYRCR